MAEVRGTMLWFNEAKDLGALRTEEGERLEVAGSAFVGGERPQGRCAGRVVAVELAGGQVERIMFVPEPAQRRARMRSRR